MAEVKLPDWEDMENLATIIKELTIEKMKLEVFIKFTETEVVKKAMSDEQYFQNGKPPSMSFIESTYKFSGFNNELIEARNKLAVLTGKLEQARIKFDMYKMQVEIYRTESANKRTATF